MYGSFQAIPPGDGFGGSRKIRFCFFVPFRTPMLGYDDKLEYARRRSTEQTARGQDIGSIPAVEDWRRRTRTTNHFSVFCKTYGGPAFSLPWSDYHKRAADRIEQAVCDGGLFAFAMPRGSGKTTLCHWGILWAILTGRCPYVLLVGATETTAEKRLKDLKATLQNNDLLLADYPEAVYPIRKLGRSARKAEGQKHHTRPTAIGWLQKSIVFPTITLDPGEGPNRGKSQMLSETSGSIIEVAGITGEIRGLRHELENGEVIRPSLAICDDPQTRESAKSRQQSEDREAVIAGDVAYLCGPEHPIAVVMPCTVVYRNDLADRMLNRQEYPEWHGERTKMVESWPSDQKLWDKYAEIRRADFLGGGNGSAATKFYRANRKAMDAGAVVTWPQRFNRDELSAIQHAVNLKLRNPAAFQAECQNEPIDEAANTARLTVEHLATKLTGLDSGRVPKLCQHLTAYIDVHKEILYWVVSAWSNDFGGGPIAYGTYPDQPVAYFAQGNPPVEMSRLHPGDEFAVISASLGVCAGNLLSREFPREDGAPMRIERLLIDTQYKRDVVQTFCRRHPHAAILLPAVGGAIGAKKKPFEDYQPEPGLGFHNVLRTKTGERHLWIDTLWWKTFAESRLCLPPKSIGGWEIPGKDASRHRLFFDHLTAERGTEVTANGRTVREWDVLPNRDNHWWDCLVGSAAAASLLGIRPSGLEPTRTRRRVSLSTLTGPKG